MQAIALRRPVINDAKDLVHIVADAVYLVSPGVFQRDAKEHPQITDYAKCEEMPDWQWAQKRFEKLLLHRKQANGLNIWTCQEPDLANRDGSMAICLSVGKVCLGSFHQTTHT